MLESRVDKGRGPVATMLVQNGTLHVGDVFIVGAVYGKVRAMFDDHGGAIKQAGPSTPVEVLGLQGVPEAGDQFQVADEAKARHIVEYRQGKAREATLAKSASGRLTLDQLHEQLQVGEVKELPVVVKADVQGSVEVLNEMLPKLSNDQVKLKVIHASVGAVNESDVLLASTSGAVIVAFNVRPERKAPNWRSAKTWTFARTRSFTSCWTNCRRPWPDCSRRSSRNSIWAAPKFATRSASRASAPSRVVR